MTKLILERIDGKDKGFEAPPHVIDPSQFLNSCSLPVHQHHKAQRACTQRKALVHYIQT